MTVPAEDDPPATEVGDKLSDVTAAGVTVSFALTETPVSVPVIFAATVAVTGEVVTINVVEVDPAGTVTVAGTTALLLLEANLTTSPPLGAGPVTVAVPVEELPPSLDREGGRRKVRTSCSCECDLCFAFNFGCMYRKRSRCFARWNNNGFLNRCCEFV